MRPTLLTGLAAVLLAACGRAETPVVNAGNMANETVVQTNDEADLQRNGQ